MARIPLFDIDKTLVTGANHTHLDAFDAALGAVYELSGVTVREIDLHGKVDTQILLEVLARHDVPRSLALEGVAEAFQHMVGYYQTHLSTGDVALLPGVRELLEELRARELPLGLLTGNVEAIAHHKLASLHIDHFFSFGGFGDMAEARSALFEPALRRAQQLGLNCTLETFLAFGDTPLDLQAAQQAGVAAIGVATGDYTQAQLKAAGAQATVAGLADHARVTELLELVVR